MDIHVGKEKKEGLALVLSNETYTLFGIAFGQATLVRLFLDDLFISK